MHLPAFLQIKTALPCRATWLDIRDVITALASHSASSRACCGRCLMLFPTAASTALRSYLCGMARSEQPNSLRSFSCFTLLPSHVITPTQSTPYHQVRTTVQSPQVSLRPDFRTSAEQTTTHHTNFATPFQAAVFPAFLPLGCHAANSSARMPSHACQTPIRQTK